MMGEQPTDQDWGPVTNRGPVTDRVQSQTGSSHKPGPVTNRVQSPGFNLELQVV